MGFPGRKDYIQAKLEEAKLAARRLGHSTTSWMEYEDGRWEIRCVTCGDIATVSVRGLGAEVSGPAAALWCKKKTAEAPTGPIRRRRLQGPT